MWAFLFACLLNVVAHREVPREAFHAATAWDPIPSLQFATVAAVAEEPDEPVDADWAAVSEEIPPGFAQLKCVFQVVLSIDPNVKNVILLQEPSSRSENHLMYI